MKKIFSLILALTAVMALNATTIIKTVSELKTENGWEVSKGNQINTKATNFDLDEVINISTTGTPNCGTVWGTDPNIDWRLYQNKGGNLIISADEGYFISAIKLNFSTTNTGVLKDENDQVVSSNDYLLYDDEVGTLRFTVGNSVASVTNGQVRVTSFEVWYYEEGEEPDQPDIWVPDTISVTQALALIAEGDEKSHYIRGLVYQEPFSPFNGCIAWWMKDEENENDSIEAFKMKKDAATPFASVEEAQGMIHEGDIVLIFANGICNYTNQTTHATFAETTEGYFAETLEEGTRISMAFDSLYVDYNRRSEEAELTFTGSESGEHATVLSLVLSDISKFAGFYKLADSIDVDDELIPNVELFNMTDNSTTLLKASLKATFVSVEGDVYTYNIIFKGKDPDGVNYDFRGEIFVTCNDANFGKYDDGSLIPKYTVARAIQEGQNGNTDIAYVYGYVSKIERQYNHANSSGQKFANAEFYLSDDPESTAETLFEAYACTPVDIVDSLVLEHQLYYVFGPLSLFHGKVEISKGTYNPVDALPEDILGPDAELEPDTISAERAYQIGKDLPEPAVKEESVTDKLYFIIGIVSARSFAEYDTEYNNQTWLMGNTPDYDGSMIQIYRAKPDASDPAKVGDKMAVTSRIKKYHGQKDDGTEYFSISTETGAQAIHTDLEIPDDADTAIPQILMDESLTRIIKTMDKGQIVIIKDGVKYNILGTRL